MIFLNHFNPANVDPTYLVDRDEDVAWMREGLGSFLRDPGSPGRAMCLVGEKGVGKSIVTRRVLSELQEIHSATTLFLTVDCRRFRDQRGVYQEIARQAVNTLAERSDVGNALLANARLLEALSSFDDVERRFLHEHLIQHQVAYNVQGGSLVKLIGKLDISLRRSEESRNTLVGRIQFGAHRLQEAVVDFFRDVRASGLDVILYLDNIDELDHDAIRDEDSRNRVRGETDGLLGLAHAPIGLVLNMRTYFASILGREIGLIRQLERMAIGDQVAMVEQRIARERPDVRVRLGEPSCRTCLESVATLATTPLAALTSFHYLCQSEQPDTMDIRQALAGLLKLRFGALSPDQIRRVAKLYTNNDGTVSREALLGACDNNSGVLTQLLMTQVVLPLDWWQPLEFRLDPELRFLVPES